MGYHVLLQSHWVNMRQMPLFSHQEILSHLHVLVLVTGIFKLFSPSENGKKKNIFVVSGELRTFWL